MLCDSADNVIMLINLDDSGDFGYVIMVLAVRMKMVVMVM